ncbi:Stigma-specific protein, Stig1 [Musa troglodytarum]|uniref:Stigma-specific protein, Stig1 n=1 Tax=Musa troglodytarum TaxID=320322 RepID=A0A9E7G2E2_9LILI|nr:Stigma-specific protein, Stig1 [Musa troglodytarum]
MVLTTSIALPVSSAESDERSGIYSLYVQYHPRGSMTCDNVPRACRASNCGQCGKKCQFGQACCGGSCNCGGCNKRCKKGSFCQYGMCSYA